MKIPILKRPSKQPVAGDVVVTHVAHHFYVGRTEWETTVLSAIGVKNSQAEALALAWRFVTGRQRVFMNENAGSPHFIEITAAHRKT